MKQSMTLLLATLLTFVSVHVNAQKINIMPYFYHELSGGKSISGPDSHCSGNRPPSLWTIAHYAVYYGKYEQVFIRLECADPSDVENSLIVYEQQKGNGPDSGWKEVVAGVAVFRCQPTNAKGASQDLERNYEFKVRVGNRWYYFDL